MTDETTSVLRLSDLRGGATARRSASLIVLSARGRGAVGRMYPLERAQTVIGRSADADIQLEEDGISRRHARLERGPEGGVRLVDLGSTNGTFVNGTRVGEVALADGDRIHLGTATVLKFSLQDDLEEEYQRSIYESAVRDGLTRIYNRKYFLDALRKEFAYCVRHGSPLALVLMDVDHFKQVNDTHGHPTGDAVLQHVCQRVAEAVRTEDLFARVGGEEFALLLRGDGEAQALACAERCRRAVEASEAQVGEARVRVTLSLGVAVLSPEGMEAPEDLLAAADRALYRAKHAGRNRVEPPDPGL
jgi:diguanylate cyclase (GGDEF)-like protein